VLRLRAPLPTGVNEPAAVLEAVEWIALGFEIIDCVYQDWKFQPADFVASYGLHAALIVGAPMAVDATNSPALAESLASFKLQLLRNGEPPSRAAAATRSAAPRSVPPSSRPRSHAVRARNRLPPAKLISSGTLTESRLIAQARCGAQPSTGFSCPRSRCG
jgi:2-oxo-3-hexenedioate decarboxylase